MPEILPDILNRTAESYPDHGIGFARPDGTVSFITFPELRSIALGYLHAFHSIGIKKGDVIILSLDKNDEVIPVLWACFYGGIIPALLQPPVSFYDYNPAAEKARKVFGLLDNPWVILSHAHADAWNSSDIPGTRLIDVSRLEELHGDPVLPVIGPQDLALVQFSSGSTGDPKGVMLSHENILINTYDISEGIKLVPEDVSTNWMPLFHDMGLIGFHITPLLIGVSHYFIEPADFVKNPFLWLETMSRNGTTVTASPNFGQMVLNRYLGRKTAGNWALSGLRVIFNGAEPISVPIMEEFIRGLEKYGCDPRAMFPAYGMAEASLAVTFPPLFSGAGVISVDRKLLLTKGRVRIVERDDATSILLVNLGKPLRNCAIKIVDDDGNQLEEDQVGNIRVMGKNVTRGYINNPQLSSALLTDGWLVTGDLGFIHEGSLFVTGRTKDIIFVNGTNFYAHDLETIAHQIPDTGYGKLVMAGYFDEKEGHDEILVFMVGSANAATTATFRKIRDLFRHTMGLNITKFIPVKSNDIPRTSSGKIQRYRLIERFRRNEFPAVMEIPQ